LYYVLSFFDVVGSLFMLDTQILLKMM